MISELEKDILIIPGRILHNLINRDSLGRLGVLKPKNIIQDKERLYEDNVNLKNIVNLLTEENNKLRSKNNCMERDLNKYEKMVEN